MTKMVGVIMSAFFAVLLLFSASPAQGGWLLYHKPGYAGKVVDIGTGAPIGGAVVAAFYRKRTLGLGAGTISSIIEIKEAVTDSSGAFHIPPYTTLIQPFSWEAACTFIIYKPGYANIGELGVEDIFSGEAKQDMERTAVWNDTLKFRFLRSGVAEIPKAVTWHDRSRSLPSLPDLEMLEKQKHLILNTNIEERNLGLQETDPYKARSFYYNRR